MEWTPLSVQHYFHITFNQVILFKLKYPLYLLSTVPSCTWRPAGKVLVCGSEVRHAAAGATGAERGTGLPPVNDCHSEGLRSEQWQWGWRTGWFLLVLISRSTWRKTLQPYVTWGQRYLSLCKKKNNYWFELFCCFVSVCESMWSIWVFWALVMYCFYHVNFRLTFLSFYTWALKWQVAGKKNNSTYKSCGRDHC